MPPTTPLRRTRLTGLANTPASKKAKRETTVPADAPHTPARQIQKDKPHPSDDETGGNHTVTTPDAPLAPLRAEVHKHMTKTSISAVETGFAAILKTVPLHSISQIPTLDLAYKISSFYESNLKRDTTILNSIVERQLSELPCFSPANSHNVDYFSEVTTTLLRTLIIFLCCPLLLHFVIFLCSNLYSSFKLTASTFSHFFLFC